MSWQRMDQISCHKGITFFLRLNNIPFYVSTNEFYIFYIHSSIIRHLIVPFGYYEKYCHEHGYINICKSLCFQFFWEEVELLDLLVILSLIFWDASVPFSRLAVPFYIPNSNECTKVLCSPHSCQHFLYYIFFLKIAIQLGVKQYLLVVSICISLMINDVESLFTCLLATWWWFSCSVVSDSLRPHGL